MNRYQDIKILKNLQGRDYYATVRYPEIPLSESDVYVITTDGDRFDTLAQQYYQDSSLWWIISIANTDLKQNSLFIPVGTQLRIPTNLTSILDSYFNLNN
jgi:hypothetical protein